MAVSKAHTRASMKYNQENMRQFKFNMSMKYDLDIIAQLDAVPNKQGYIKELIRADIARRGPAQKDQAEEETNTKTWFIVDDATTSKGRLDVAPTGTADKQTAIVKAIHAWHHLTQAEQTRRDDFYIALGQAGEDGLLDWNTITETISIKYDGPTE